jgi:hypothetical protein
MVHGVLHDLIYVDSGFHLLLPPIFPFPLLPLMEPDVPLGGLAGLTVAFGTCGFGLGGAGGCGAGGVAG